MPSLIEAAKSIIDAMPGSAAMFPGGVWTRPIMPDDRTGPDGFEWKATPEAFRVDVPIQIMRCVSLNQPPRTSSGTNWFDQYYDYVECWYYGPDTPEDRVILSDAMEAIRSAFRNRPVQYSSGFNKIVLANDRQTLQPTGEFFNAISGVERFAVVSYDF